MRLGAEDIAPHSSVHIDDRVFCRQVAEEIEEIEQQIMVSHTGASRAIIKAQRWQRHRAGLQKQPSTKAAPAWPL